MTRASTLQMWEGPQCPDESAALRLLHIELVRVVCFNTAAFQQRAQLGEMFMIPRFDCA